MLYSVSLLSKRGWKGLITIPYQNHDFFVTTEQNRMGIRRGADN